MCSQKFELHYDYAKFYPVSQCLPSNIAVKDLNERQQLAIQIKIADFSVTIGEEKLEHIMATFIDKIDGSEIA